MNELQIGLVRAHSLAIRDLRKWYQKKDTIESSDPRVVFSIKGRPDMHQIYGERKDPVPGLGRVL